MEYFSTSHLCVFHQLDPREISIFIKLEVTRYLNKVHLNSALCCSKLGRPLLRILKRVTVHYSGSEFPGWLFENTDF